MVSSGTREKARVIKAETARGDEWECRMGVERVLWFVFSKDCPSSPKNYAF